MGPAAAMAQMSEQQLRAGVEQTYGVRVLKMKSETVAGRRAFLATVMNPGGAFNEAFQVNTIAIDAATGKLIPGFRHQASGLVKNQSPSYRTGRQSADSFRQGFTWR
jgi:hypothetical protein